MVNKIFIDSDILLDVLLERHPHFENSQKIIALVEKCVFRGFTSSLILANCFYIIENNFSRARAGEFSYQEAERREARADTVRCLGIRAGSLRRGRSLRIGNNRVDHFRFD